MAMAVSPISADVAIQQVNTSGFSLPKIGIQASPPEAAFEPPAPFRGRPIDDEALHEAIENNDDNTLPTIIALLAQGANVNYPDSKGRTPLHVAVIQSNIEAALTLVDYGADIMYQSTLIPRSPLNLALLNANLSGLDTDKSYQERMKKMAFMMQGLLFVWVVNHSTFSLIPFSQNVMLMRRLRRTLKRSQTFYC